MTMGQRISRIVLPPVILFVALGAYRFAIVRPVADRITPATATPHKIAPRFSEPRIATDEQLTAVLNRVKPPATKDQMTNNWVHALRLWGTEADFHDDKTPSLVVSPKSNR